jgi:hypothetical protein
MPSPDAAFLDGLFNDLLDRIRAPAALNPAKSDPVFHFVYPPESMLELKRRLPLWTSKAVKAGFKVHRVSLANILWDVVDKSGRWDDWIASEAEAEWDQINRAVRDVLSQGNAFLDRVIERTASAPKDAVALLTEAELLHPYFRVRAIENALHGKITIPTVIFYPGRHSGQFSLQFLGYYPVDGNYRSTLLGGL